MASHAIFHEPGLGKTRTCLEIYSDHKRRNPDLKLLVICPISLINAAWGADIAKFTSFRYVPYKEASKHNIDFDITALNYESLISVNYFERVKQMVKNGHYMAVIDESSRLKSYKSLTTKKLLELAPYFDYKYVCSGTPCPNGEIEIWAQISFICDILPKSFFAFRNIYFSLQRGGKEIQGQIMSRLAMRDLMMKGWKYSIKASRREEFYRLIARYVHWVKKDDALDLPDQVDQIRDVILDQKEHKSYEDMRKHLIIDLGGTDIVAQTALTKIMKLRQVTSGFAYDENHNTALIGHSKRKILEEVLEELGNKQVIVWIQFKEEARQLLDLLGEKAGALYSDAPNRDETIRKFKEGEIQYLIAHPKSAAHGLTFVNCSYQIFYSLDYSYESHEQARSRIHRIGQGNKCTYVYILAKDTIDYALLAVLRKKQSLQDALYGLLR